LKYRGGLRLLPVVLVKKANIMLLLRSAKVFGNNAVIMVVCQNYAFYHHDYGTWF